MMVSKDRAGAVAMMQETPEGGVYFERKVFLSAAYLALSKNGRMALLAMLDARQKNPAYKPSGKGFRTARFVNLDQIKMPYTKLREKYGIPTQSIPRAIDELLANGFIEIKHVGGAGEHDMSVYALIEDYLQWTVGVVFRQRHRDVRRGFQGRKLGVAKVSHSKSESYTHLKSESFGTQNASLEIT